MTRAGEAPPPRSPRPPLWCFTGGGSPALALLAIASALPADQTVHALQAHGYEGRAWPDWTVAGAARRYAREIRRIAPVGPYPLVGHSFGGLLALETARVLTGSGHEVPFVMMLDTVLPVALGGTGLSVENDGDADPTAVSVPGLRQRLRMHRRVATAGLVEFSPQVRDDVFWERSLRMTNRYRPEPWPGRLVLIMTQHNRDSVDGWSPIATGELVVLRVPGGHSSMLRPPFNAPVVAALRDELDDLRGLSGGARNGVPGMNPGGRVEQP